MTNITKPKFYIFLDIDGTLWDYYTLSTSSSYFYDPNPKAMYALHTLINSLRQKFEPDLVISSTRRIRWEKCKDYLYKEAGLHFDEALLHRTQVDNLDRPRGMKIAEYMLADQGKSINSNFFINFPIEALRAKKVNKQMTGRYVVIDDNIEPLKSYIPKQNLIKTNIYRQSLSIEMVSDFLENFGLDVVDEDGNVLSSVNQEKA